ncbi:unnamed protein product [Hymenolepis diminuta]|uniref:Uncharacterized protein n=1 Tax=Hymenolepis diminuta TaxID=6216 RepID=A0A564YSC5_HYMDI|nr:unnamed protein product [Hymenolepis diminuta]
MISQVTEPIVSSKKDVKQNEKLQKNPHERVTKTRGKNGKNRGQHPEKEYETNRRTSSEPEVGSYK